MKPQDLKHLIDYKSVLPCFIEKVLLVPRRSFKSPFFPEKIEKFELFSNSQPLCIEFCSGNGDWIVNKAKEFPEKNWLAVEMRFDRVQKIWSKMQNQKISNLVCVCAEAQTFSQYYLSDSSVEEIYINFPDPWPKRRHEKHRLVQGAFVKELARILKKEKKITLATDDSEYLHFTIKNVLSSSLFQPAMPAPFFVSEIEGYGSSWFEALWRNSGKEIYYTQFEKKI